MYCLLQNLFYLAGFALRTGTCVPVYLVLTSSTVAIHQFSLPSHAYRLYKGLYIGLYVYSLYKEGLLKFNAFPYSEPQITHYTPGAWMLADADHEACASMTEFRCLGSLLLQQSTCACQGLLAKQQLLALLHPALLRWGLYVSICECVFVCVCV